MLTLANKILNLIGNVICLNCVILCVCMCYIVCVLFILKKNQISWTDADTSFLTTFMTTLMG